MSAREAQYQWRENMACVATYNILEGDKFLDQFEDSAIPFSKAGKVKLGNLRYYPRTTTNSNILELVALGIAQNFSTCLVKTYTVSKQDKNTPSSAIMGAIAAVFKDGNKSICDLAEIVDANIKFPDEV